VPALYRVLAAVAAIAIVVIGVPSWVALAAGIVIAVGSGFAPPPALERVTTYSLQLGVVALGAGMNLVTVWEVGSSGALVTVASLATAIIGGLVLGRVLRIAGDMPLLISVGTAICGGSAIAAVASAIRPHDEETSVSLAVVFVLNAIALVAFPLVGHALGLSEPTFGRWAALGIHDTSSVVGAGLAYGPQALAIATTTKLARALWIVPVTLVIAAVHQRRQGGSLRSIKWPWFILGFVGVAALFTWVTELAPIAETVTLIGRRALLLALFLIGLSLSRAALQRVGARPLVLGLVLWLLVAGVSLGLATLG
jgi:uncharacterized integral membrane protein (TIGR00698 family)